MLNGDLKDKAISRLETAKKKYEEASELTATASEALFNIRHYCSNRLIHQIESYFNQISNKPNELDKDFVILKTAFQNFESLVDDLRKEARDNEVKAGGSAFAGVGAAAGFAMFAPSAAMGIATTFGTASTGAAISTLGGAAATNAALAWLGGGAIVAGGGGMSAGSALLALAGPIGWAIGGSAIAGSALYARNKNTKLATETEERTKVITIEYNKLLLATKEIDRLISLTHQHKQASEKHLNMLEKFNEINYLKMTEQQHILLQSLINNTRSLSELIKKQIEL